MKGGGKGHPDSFREVTPALWELAQVLAEIAAEGEMLDLSQETTKERPAGDHDED